MTTLVKYRMLAIIVALFAILGTAWSACNDANGDANTLTVVGPDYVGIGTTNAYTFVITNDVSGQSVTVNAPDVIWTVPTGFSVSPAGASLNSVSLDFIAPNYPSINESDKTIKCEYTKTGWSGAAECNATKEITVVKVSVYPTSMTAEESKDSSSSNCLVHPTTLTPDAYKWLTGSEENAWPSTAGNDPQLDYENPQSQVTKVLETQWFAPTPSKDIEKDGPVSIYKISCEVEIDGVKIRDITPSKLSVEVDPEGVTIGPTFDKQETITTYSTGFIFKTFKVSSMGGFCRSAVSRGVSPPETSDFYDKCCKHEDEHVDQWENQAPWKDLWDAQSLYDNTLKNLTASSEYKLREKIYEAIDKQHDEDKKVVLDSMYLCEKGAFDAQNDVPPDFLEWTEAGWMKEYGIDKGGE